MLVFLMHCATILTKGWNQSGKKKSSFAISAKHLLKRRYPLSPLISRQGDAQTACHIGKEKGYRISFENVPFKPIPPSSVMSCPGELKNHHEESTQHQNLF